ncbi:ABC-three component system middle component 1 [Escherichia coli]|uniref:ABC-three component system middle component 1 n=1 Tax=Escherichia coli TaxID=562 RepID=UPI000CFBCFC9|nr:ABC-three component system middle component 1 [Escherichia coli]
MINKLIDEALISHGFSKEYETDTTGFYISELDSAIRFAILHKLNELPAPAELNAIINQLVPDVFKNDPTFKKNCDLICIHHLNKLAEFKNHEEQIFAIEEDPHFFKKYVLYYSSAEESALEDFSFEKLKATIADKNQFIDYKNDPLRANQYSVAAKIFIKLPFLELPFNKGNLVSLRLQAAEAVAEAGLDTTYELVHKFTDKNADDMIKEIITNELANIPN